MKNPLTKDLIREYNIVEYSNINEIFISLYKDKFSKKEFEKLLENSTREEIILKNEKVRKYEDKYYYSEKMQLVDEILKERAKQDCLNIHFWKNELIKFFDLNEVGEELLNIFIESNENDAKKFIINKFKKIYREEILDMYSERFYTNKINQILKELNYQEITEKDIDEYRLKILEKYDESEEEEM